MLKVYTAPLLLTLAFTACLPFDPEALDDTDTAEPSDSDTDSDTDTEVDISDADEDGVTAADGDCDDNDSTVYPGAPEVFDDSVDHDCDGFSDREGSVCQSSFTVNLPGGLHVQLDGCGEWTADPSYTYPSDGPPAISGANLTFATSPDAETQCSLTITAEEICGVARHGTGADGTSTTRTRITSLACDDNISSWSTPYDHEGALYWSSLDVTIAADDGEGDPSGFTIAGAIEVPFTAPDDQPRVAGTFTVSATHLAPAGTPAPTCERVGADNDGDGYQSWLISGNDCDDEDALTYPGAAAEEPSLCGRDADGDGYAAIDLDHPERSGTDCDDTNADVFPGAAANEPSLCAEDADGDGYGSSSPSGDVEAGTDCDDADANIFPGAATKEPSLCAEDADGDGYGASNVSGALEAGSDCDDADSLTFPNAPDRCDGQFNGCGSSTSWNPSNELGRVTFIDPSGNVRDVTADFSGTASAPSTPSLQSGRYEFCDGTYYMNGTIPNQRNITFEGMRGRDVTLLDGASVGRVLSVGAASTFDLQGLTVQHGYALNNDGGGIFINSNTDTTISDARFYQNVAGSQGGGIRHRSGQLTITDVEFIENQGNSRGGGVMTHGYASFTRARFEKNKGGEGLGVYAFGDVDFSDCTFHNNGADFTHTPAVEIRDGTATFTDTSFTDNGADAMTLSGSDVELLRVEASGSSANNGGVIDLIQGTTLTMVDSHVHDNIRHAFTLASGTQLTCIDSKIQRNSSPNTSAGGVRMYDLARFDSQNCDFGSGSSANSPATLQFINTSNVYNYTGPSTFICNLGTCTPAP